VSVVVTGMGVVSSIGGDVASFSAALRRGDSGITTDPWGPEGPPFGAIVRGFTLRDALSARHGLPLALRSGAERSLHRAPLPLQVAAASALEAWEHAGLHDTRADQERLAVVVAGNNLTGGYVDAQRPAFARNPAHLVGRFALQVQDTDHVGTISEILGIRGEGFTIGGASASGNLALIQASRLLELDVVDVCLVVGAMANLSAMEMRAFINLGTMVCRLPAAAQSAGPPFDSTRRGFVLGQACACVVLESHTSAAHRGAQPLAELAGYAVQLDGNRLADPSEAGEAAVMTRAIAKAGLKPHHITYVNTHGSGSTLGDVVELTALRRVFGEGVVGPWLNATKALTGHCIGAAGVVEAAATVTQMQESFVHPNPGLDDPIHSDCRFARARAISTAIPYALSNSFGFGGINTSILFAHPYARAA
jgi:malonyl-ACP decarboxylase